MEPLAGLFFDEGEMSSIISSTRLVLFGVLIILFLVIEPEGLNRLWRNIRTYFRVWPFSY
jgi:branched-chain amino acid transport system permease protein